MWRNVRVVVGKKSLLISYSLMKNKKILLSIGIWIFIITIYTWYTQYKNMDEIQIEKETIINEIENPEVNQIISNLSISEFKKEMEMWDKILLDIRTQEELTTFGMISEDALHLDIYNQKFNTELDKLDKSKKYLIYCYHGNRTKVALDMMKAKGFGYVKDLDSWIDVWINLGEKVFK